MSYTPRFNKAVQFELDHETVFEKGHFLDYDYAISENVRNDNGGLTKYGIDQRSHPEVDIDNLTLDQAINIYYNDYWLPSQAEDMPPGYGEVLFDIRVNGGNGPLMAQEVLNQNGARLSQDGAVGPRTIAEMIRQGDKGLRLFLKLRQQRYNVLAQNPSKAKFLQGWTNRNNDLADFVGIEL